MKNTTNKPVTFYLSPDEITALQSIAEQLTARGVIGMMNDKGKRNKSAVIRYLISKEQSNATQ